MIFRVFIFTLSLLSCSIDYDALDGEYLAENIPDIVAYGLEVTDVGSNGERRILTAEKAELFEDKKITILYNLNFLEIKDEEPIAKGSVSYAQLSSGRDLIELKKGLDFYSYDRETRITSEALTFDQEDAILSTPINKEVRIQEDNGTTLVGQGFQGDILKNTYSFAEINGVLKSENKTDEEITSSDDASNMASYSLSTLFYELLEKPLAVGVIKEAVLATNNPIILLPQENMDASPRGNILDQGASDLDITEPNSIVNFNEK